MRLKITFNRTGKQRMLPMDYQYYISAWIYKVLKLADRDFAAFLHEQGYGNSPTKLYKLFCFSRLNFGKPKLWKAQKLFEISGDQLSLDVSFDVNDAGAHFIKGLFMAREFYLGSKFNGIDLKVTAVEALPEPPFGTTAHYRLITPWVLSHQSGPNRQIHYLKTDDPDFRYYSVKHLKEKYTNTRGQAAGDWEIDFRPAAGPAKRAGFLIKPGTPQETRVVGNLFGFKLEAPPEIHRMIWNAGAGEKSSLGFGWVEVV
jgi:CRISPR-associated endoribonuclease Cas6